MRQEVAAACPRNGRLALHRLHCAGAGLLFLFSLNVCRLRQTADMLRGQLTFAFMRCAQAICLQTSSAGAAAFLASLTTVVCPLIESLTGQRLSKKAWTATFLAVCGAACLEFGAGEMPKSGDVIGLLQPLLFGIYLFKTENALEKYPDQVNIASCLCASVCVCWSVFPTPTCRCALSQCL